MRCDSSSIARNSRDSGSDLGGDSPEHDRGMVGVELDRSVRGGEPFVGPVDPVVIVRRLDDHRRDALPARSDQHVRVGPAFQHREVGLGDFARQRTHRHHLADQCLDPASCATRPDESTGAQHEPADPARRYPRPTARAAARLRDRTAGSAPACPHRCHWCWRGGTNTDAGPPTRSNSPDTRRDHG